MEKIEQATPHLPKNLKHGNGKLNLSKLVREATEWFLDLKNRETLKRELDELYKANSASDRQLDVVWNGGM